MNIYVQIQSPSSPSYLDCRSGPIGSGPYYEPVCCSLEFEDISSHISSVHFVVIQIQFVI